ncbi:hypothetical protein M408DRAFT_329134, partial [Serendipita vermifera MAFF 305830]
MNHAQAAQIIQANQEHFNKVAVDGGYDSNPFVEQVTRQIAEVIRESFPFDEESTVLLDYACGTGQMSRHLAPYTRQIIGADITQGMVDYYNQRVYNQGIPPDQMRAICLTGTDSDLDGQKFDLIVCSQAYHHFPNIAAVTKTLASLLKPGTGKLFVADLMPYDTSIFKQHGQGQGHQGHGHSHDQGHGHGHGHSHDQGHDHGHSHSHSHGHEAHEESHDAHEPFQGPAVVRKGGFEESEIQTVFTEAGLVDWQFIENAASAEMKNKRVELFLAVGRRPES